MISLRLNLTPDELAVGRALNSTGAQFTTANAKDGAAAVFVYVNGTHIATVGGRSPVAILRSLAHFAEQARDIDGMDKK